MGTKQNPGKFDCYANAAEDEPMFILLARDKHAPALVWLWATMRELDGEAPEKVAEARQCAQAMIDYQRANGRPTAGISTPAIAGILDLIKAANYYSDKVEGAVSSEDFTRLVLSKTTMLDMRSGEKPSKPKEEQPLYPYK